MSEGVITNTIPSEGMSWSFQKIWNDSLLKRNEREFKARDYIYASELGGAFIDRYLRMTGVIPTNPPNDRSFRKFEAGNMWERHVKFVLKRAGILVKAQEHLEYQYPELLSVHGRLDFLAGGKPNFEQARKEVENHKELFEDIVGEDWIDRTYFIIDELEKQYKNDLKQIIIEVKSCSQRMYDLMERTNRPQTHHALQAFHYIKSKEKDGFNEARLVYISKDDCLMHEFPIFAKPETEEIYREDIEVMTKYYNAGAQPPVEPLILFDALTGKFRSNWKVEYSNYLTMLYGYETPKAYRDDWGKKATSFTRVLDRVIEDKKMTDKNLEVIDEVKKLFPFDEVVRIAKDLKSKGLLEEEVEENGNGEKPEPAIKVEATGAISNPLVEERKEE